VLGLAAALAAILASAPPAPAAASPHAGSYTLEPTGARATDPRDPREFTEARHATVSFAREEVERTPGGTTVELGCRPHGGSVSWNISE
jgi:hypothetical protein